MPTLLFRFSVHLVRRDIGPMFLPSGPLFHRWLPEGEKDAIALDTGDQHATLKVWFEQRGCVDNGFIKFDPSRQEIDPTIIPRQGILYGGSLSGMLELADLPNDDVSFFADPVPEDPRYEATGRKVIQLLYAPLRRFLDILRTHLGQYWIASLEDWDSRRMSLGAYCGRLNLRGSVDGGLSWFDFVPNKPVVMLTVKVGSIKFDQYLTRRAWDELANAIKTGFQPSLAAQILVRAHELADGKELRYAFTEAITGLEVAIGETVRSTLGTSMKLVEAAESFWTLPLRAQAALLLGAAHIKQADIEAVLEAIEIRNKILHEGWAPPEEEGPRKQLVGILMGLLRAVAALIGGIRFRFPSAYPGNVLLPNEDAWEAEYVKAGMDNP